MTKYKHLTLSNRITIEIMLKEAASFKAIARELNKDCTTISKEVRSHLRFKKTGCFGHAFNDCLNRFSCSLSHLCHKPGCSIRRCCFCSSCSRFCSDYSKQTCPNLVSPPYVCNGCSQRSKCTLEKRLYSASFAQQEYELVRSESRCGLCLSELEAVSLDSLISPLLLKGQSLHAICVNNAASIMFSERSLYNYVDARLFSATNLDLPRKVRFHPRKSRHDSFKVDKTCRKGRSFQDFLAFLDDRPGCPIVQLDSVEGLKGGKVLLTIHFVKAEFMLAFLRDRNTAASVSAVFNQLYQSLQPPLFRRLFPVLLTDNGSEFSDPLALERDQDGSLRSLVFYCDPNSPQQKGAAENNHSLLRRVIPKGTSFEFLTQEQVSLMMNHINSYCRENLGDRTPYEMFRLLYGEDALEALGAVLISPNDIVLRPSLLK